MNLNQAAISGSELDAQYDAMASLVECNNPDCSALWSEGEAYESDYVCSCGSRLIDQNGHTIKVGLSHPANWY